MVVSAGITSLLAAGMFTAVTAVQKSTAATNHHMRSQIQQARLLDYISRDLRRALTVNVAAKDGEETLKLTIPDFYDAAGSPREPVITKGNIVYGDAAGVQVSYVKKGNQVLRRFREKEDVLAVDVQDFHLDFTDDGKQTIAVSINFVPRYQFTAKNAESVREGTTTYTTTLLRNKRLK
jgi:hypothetical protein